MHVWALTLQMVMLWDEFFYCVNDVGDKEFYLGGYIGMRSRYILLRPSVHINVYVVSSLVCCTASSIAYNFACRMLGYPSSLAEICVFVEPLKTPSHLCAHYLLRQRV